MKVIIVYLIGSTLVLGSICVVLMWVPQLKKYIIDIRNKDEPLSEKVIKFLIWVMLVQLILLLIVILVGALNELIATI